jgi:hypothetical protein
MCVPWAQVRYLSALRRFLSKSIASSPSSHFFFCACLFVRNALFYFFWFLSGASDAEGLSVLGLVVCIVNFSTAPCFLCIYLFYFTFFSVIGYLSRLVRRSPVKLIRNLIPVSGHTMMVSIELGLL